MGIERGCAMGGGVGGRGPGIEQGCRCRCGRPAPRATWTASLPWESIQGESGGGNGLGDGVEGLSMDERLVLSL